MDEIVADIKRYLRGHAGAADTLEGIARWWVVRSRVDALIPRVTLALAQLIDEGLLTRQRLPDGSFIYASGMSGQKTATPQTETTNSTTRR